MIHEKYIEKHVLKGKRARVKSRAVLSGEHSLLSREKQFLSLRMCGTEAARDKRSTFDFRPIETNKHD